jgi:hypothetical protein
MGPGRTFRRRRDVVIMRILAAVFADVVFRLAESGTRDYAAEFDGYLERRGLVTRTRPGSAR